MCAQIIKNNQEDYLQISLTLLLKEDGNKSCADCGVNGPLWASWNLGVFVCLRCAGHHRNLGVHISKVKSVNLDKWTPEQLEIMQRIGNKRAGIIYEAKLSDSDFRRPQTDAALSQFIRAKYEYKKYMASKDSITCQPVVNSVAAVPKSVSANLEVLPVAQCQNTVSVTKNTEKCLTSTKIDHPKVEINSISTPKPVECADLLSLDDVFPTNNSHPSVPGTQSMGYSTALAKSVELESGIEQLDNIFANDNVIAKPLVSEEKQVISEKASKESILALYGCNNVNSQNPVAQWPTFGISAQAQGYPGITSAPGIQIGGNPCQMFNPNTTGQVLPNFNVIQNNAAIAQYQQCYNQQVYLQQIQQQLSAMKMNTTAIYPVAENCNITKTSSYQQSIPPTVTASMNNQFNNLH